MSPICDLEHKARLFDIDTEGYINMIGLALKNGRMEAGTIGPKDENDVPEFPDWDGNYGAQEGQTVLDDALERAIDDIPDCDALGPYRASIAGMGAMETGAAPRPSEIEAVGTRSKQVVREFIAFCRECEFVIC